MREFLDQVQRASGADLYYVALASGLMIPDIAGAMEADDGRATRERYVDWFDRYVGPAYAPTLNGEDCYGLRCALLHQGRLTPHAGSYSRVLFLEPGTTGIVMHRNVINDALNIDVQVFVADLLAGANGWLADAEDTSVYQRNLEASMRRHPNGLAPYIDGTPVIG